jgi:hypothetical protein
MPRTRRLAQAVMVLLTLGYSSLGAAELGWAVSELVVVPQPDFRVTGTPPFQCLGEEEMARLRRDPVHRFQVWLVRWLEETFDMVQKLQTYDNCARTCAAIPLDAQAIIDLRGYARVLPDGRFQDGGEWPGEAGFSRWEEAIDTSGVVEGKRLVCATIHNWQHDADYEGYFIVYFER